MQFHGAYAFVGKDGTYYTAGNDYVAGYNNKNLSDPESPIVRTKRHNLPDFHSNEHLVGLSVTWDGFIVWVTNYGKIGVISEDFKF